jgi:hypothetical protein
MTMRERYLAGGVLFVIVLAGAAFLFYNFLFVPLHDRDGNIRYLTEENEKKAQRIQEVVAKKPLLARWQILSLPSDIDLARREYERYLSGLFREGGFAAGTFSVVPRPTDAKSSPSIPGKGPIYIKLSFNVLAHGNLGNLVHVLLEFYRTGLLQQIRNLSIQRPVTITQQQQPDDLDINLTVEALTVTGGGNRPYLLPNIEPKLWIADSFTALLGGPGGLLTAVWAASPVGPLGRDPLATPHRDYGAIASKNIFFGDGSQPAVAQEEVELTRFWYLISITSDGRKREAFLYDRASNHKTRLRAEAGFNSFRVLDDKGETLVRGRVTKIEARDVVFQVENKNYAIHVGQNLEDAMKNSLSPQQLKTFETPEAVEKVTKGK